MLKVREVIERGIRKGTFPGAVVLVAHEGHVVFLEAFGHRTLIPHPQPMATETIFDLASMTKVFATTMAVMKLVDEGKMALDQPLTILIPSADLGEKKDLTPRLLLTHSSGLPDHKPYFKSLIEYPLDLRRNLMREWIIREPFAYGPGAGSLYSDLGFMLLEWVIEVKTGRSLKDFVVKTFYEPLGLKSTFFQTEQTQVDLERFAATQYCPWRKRLLLGEVDDENAFALGGFAGHAGLFSTAEEIWVLAGMLREHYLGTRSDFFRPAIIREFFRRQDIVAGSDWALGWDTCALSGSSAGKYFSRKSVGHTGFTGTSVWIDLEKDVTAVFLTNRVHPTRNNTETFRAFRPEIHDAIMEDLKNGILE